ncbi:hypothetical protein C1Y63_07280 [Corynebacterium sp. 13CS0277]|uniref:hypothetical protein n=1 Tax=Corynebacterium sp. 13CS0277 TaxID=2071994 RepID=UPI000D02975C|nr:hypothetical protein [Corynebacterium sp. 13CS0277]PRQ11190.1 hypothetical protein C1Y63_07280 [Corynebacterium sp. 13CS0277]
MCPLFSYPDRLAMEAVGIERAHDTDADITATAAPAGGTARTPASSTRPRKRTRNRSPQPGGPQDRAARDASRPQQVPPEDTVQDVCRHLRAIDAAAADLRSAIRTLERRITADSIATTDVIRTVRPHLAALTTRAEDLARLSAPATSDDGQNTPGTAPRRHADDTDYVQEDPPQSAQPVAQRVAPAEHAARRVRRPSYRFGIIKEARLRSDREALDAYLSYRQRRDELVAFLKEEDNAATRDATRQAIARVEQEYTEIWWSLRHGTRGVEHLQDIYEERARADYAYRNPAHTDIDGTDGDPDIPAFQPPRAQIHTRLTRFPRREVLQAIAATLDRAYGTTYCTMVAQLHLARDHQPDDGRANKRTREATGVRERAARTSPGHVRTDSWSIRRA